MSEEIIKIIEYLTNNPDICAVGIIAIVLYTLFFILFAVAFIAIEDGT